MKNKLQNMKIMTINIEDISDKDGKGYYAKIEELKITVMADTMNELFDAIKSSIAVKNANTPPHPESEQNL